MQSAVQELSWLHHCCQHCSSWDKGLNKIILIHTNNLQSNPSMQEVILAVNIKSWVPVLGPKNVDSTLGLWDLQTWMHSMQSRHTLAALHGGGSFTAGGPSSFLRHTWWQLYPKEEWFQKALSQKAAARVLQIGRRCCRSSFVGQRCGQPGWSWQCKRKTPQGQHGKQESFTKGMVQEHHRNSWDFLIAAQGHILVPKLCHKVFQVVVPLLFPEANAR